ncbi:MAG: hypothetical protein HY722_04665 [Planctomycetes bacterium]|nr:hypothetical protein [Planctomycetota bacterium]
MRSKGLVVAAGILSALLAGGCAILKGVKTAGCCLASVAGAGADGGGRAAAHGEGPCGDEACCGGPR